MNILRVIGYSLCFSLAAANSIIYSDAQSSVKNIDRNSAAGAGFFSKSLDYEGVAIKAPDVVQDTALIEARRRLHLLLKNMPAVRANLRSQGAELHIIGKDQVTSDLPEHLDAKGKPFEGKMTIDERTRGVGGIFASCGEENLLHLKGDRYFDRDICLHEFAHTIMEFGLDQPLRDAIGKQYSSSLGSGHWKNSYAGTNEREFFAELSMWYFGSRGDYGKIKPEPQPGREWLSKYDRESYKLIDDIYSGRLAPVGISFKSIVAISPMKEASLRSGNSRVATTLLFINSTAEVVKVYWLDFNGQRKPYGQIPAYGRQSQSTFVGHPFILTNLQGRGLAIFLAEPQAAIAILKK